MVFLGNYMLHTASCNMEGARDDGKDLSQYRVTSHWQQEIDQIDDKYQCDDPPQQAKDQAHNENGD